MWKAFIMGILMIGLVVSNDHGVEAAEKDQDLSRLVKKAFDAQVQLSEKERSMKEIIDILNPYFTNDIITSFLKKNLVRTDHGYQTFGTDFPQYYVPFFSYNNHTKVIHTENARYVIEKMSDKGEGPVQYDNAYQGVKLIKVNEQWKINEVLMDVPKEIINRSTRKEGIEEESEKKGQLKSEDNNKQNTHELPYTLQKILMINSSIGIPFHHRMLRSFYPLM